MRWESAKQGWAQEYWLTILAGLVEKRPAELQPTVDRSLHLSQFVTG
jgi:hypothetical protein